LWPSYSASKSALVMIIKELAAELSKHQIRVNGIAPGWVKIDEDGNTFDSNKNIIHQTSIEPSYIGRAALYLASEYFSKYTTGEIIKVDSGQTLLSHNNLNNP
ncbi:MAG: SDR family NAD(P)-dependent oxidoreductase, partial [Thermodesulfobacteriota bacterium]